MGLMCRLWAQVMGMMCRAMGSGYGYDVQAMGSGYRYDVGQWRLFNDAQIYNICIKDVLDPSAFFCFTIEEM
jgi:hypothetical protein